jgi:cytidylate kinase
MQQQHIIVSGIPASGKSTVGRAIAEALSLEMFDKDEILEDLFNEKGVGDVDWRTALSRAADEILRDQALRSKCSVIVSWWRHPASNLLTGTPIDWLSELQGELIEVHCICNPTVAAERFKSRKRHSGHLDHFKSSADLLKTFEQHASLGPLRIGRLLEVNTEGQIELADLLSGIKPLA